MQKQKIKLTEVKPGMVLGVTDFTETEYFLETVTKVEHGSIFVQENVYENGTSDLYEGGSKIVDIYVHMEVE
jgi:hypothetical protein